jgi:hypothetical protein
MKKTLIRLGIGAVMIAGILPLTGLAQGYGRYGVNSRQAQQRGRIRQGIRSGELTRREARGLVRQQGRIEAYERRSLRDDGRLDYRERRNLNHMLNRSNRSIYRQKTDRQDRNDYRRRWRW